MSEKRAQSLADWLGFYATIAGCIAALIFSRLADVFSGHMKSMILVYSNNVYVLVSLS